MKTISKILIVLLGTIILVTMIVILFFRQEAYQFYKVLTFFEKDNISENFREVRNIFRTSTVPKPEHAFVFPISDSSLNLPETFQFYDSIINTQDYLDYTLTDALLIIKNDTLYYEYYSNGFTQNDHHISWSMSKSIISALFGIAMEEGYIKSIEETVTDYLPEFAGTGYEGVRIKDVLQMSSGVHFNEDYGDFNSDINVMGRYFALGLPMADFAKRLTRDKEPGTFNHYVSIDTQVLAMILTRATGKTITEYMTEKLWLQIGAEAEAYWVIDKAGMEFALGGLNASARDYAKVGRLFLDSGRWNGNQIVPEDWVIASVNPDSDHLKPGKRSNASHKHGYGFQWWIPEGAEDEFNAQGIYGQLIYVDPDKKTIVVKLSSNYHFKNDRESFFHDIDIIMFRSIIDKMRTEVRIY